MVRGTRQLAIVLVAMAAAVMLASGLAVAATFTGTNGDDNIKGTDQADEIYGEAGKDTLKGMAANDKVFGGADDDTLYGDDTAGTAASGDDNVQGEGGNDKVFGGPDKDVVKGGPGNDTVQGEVGADLVHGGEDDDTVSGADPLNATLGDGANKVYGDNGNDEVLGGSNADDLYGGSGEDFILGGPVERDAPDIVYGGDGDDEISVANNPASKETIIDCGAGVDTVEADHLDVVESNCENVTVTPADADPTATPPGYDPNAPDTIQEPLETYTVPADGGATTQEIAGSTCESRRDTPHASRSAKPIPYAEVLAIVGVRYCHYKKKSIYVDTKLQKYAGYFYTVRRIRATAYNAYEINTYLAWRCPPISNYYRGVLYDAVIRDYDGDVHYMLFSRYSRVGAATCAEYA